MDADYMCGNLASVIHLATHVVKSVKKYEGKAFEAEIAEIWEEVSL
jgi:hypothetical protein